MDAPVAHSRTFSYSIPHRFVVEPGQLVWVPFGRRVAQGVVAELAAAPRVEVTRDILQPIDPAPLVSRERLVLARWLSGYYLCSLFDAISPLLPPGFEAQVRSRIYPVPRAGEAPGPNEADWTSLTGADLSFLRPEAAEVLRELDSRTGYDEQAFTKLLGRNGERALARLLDKGLVRRQTELPRPRVATRYESFLFPVYPREPQPEDQTTGVRLGRRQEDLLLAVRERAPSYPAVQANKEFGHGVATALIRKGLLGQEWVRLEPQAPATTSGDAAGPPLELTPEQGEALEQVVQAIADRRHTPRVFLLHGVTGSGKTEVYLRAIQHTIALGRQAVFLVPEISLTPQTMQRVNARFPGRVVTLHSGLTRRHQFDQWWKINDGDYDVVVGPRSALFAPLSRLGLIVIDEEHEWTYKQEEAHPLYHARTVADELARLTGAVVVLGSATPDVETYYHAKRGRSGLLELPRRIGSSLSRPELAPPELAPVEVVDMRRELREGNRDIFSRALVRALQDRIGRGQQAILFLNRRGSAPIVQCRDCGHVASCASCSVALAYHSADGRMMCHRCNRRTRPPAFCRQCRGKRVRSLGIGTQKVVERVCDLLPGARVERWDADATRAGLAPEQVMERLQNGETQVLVGTQLVAKGLDVPNVTLVGVVLADVGLHLPDFRAGERAFGLLCQVAGRAGRGQAPGKVVVQTYTPEHYAVAAAAQHDYHSMFRQEIQTRRRMGNPPFNRLVHLVCQDVNDSLCQREAASAARELRQQAVAEGLTDVEIIGPARGMPSRLRGRYRWHLIVRGRNLHEFLQGFLERRPFPRGCTVDVDPVHLL